MPRKIIHIDDVGEVVLEHSRRVTRINLTVKPFKGVRVAVPLRVSLHQGEMVARTKIAWLKKHVIRIAAIEKKAVDFHKTHGGLEARRARTEIVQRVRELAALHGFSYSRISIRNQKTRWGSCSMRNSLNLNIHLAHLPPALMDYVILHELVHTRVRNHSSAFWLELRRYVDSPRQLDRELSSYGFLLAR